MGSTQRAPGLRSELEDLFHTALQAAYPDVNEKPLVVPCNNPKFGDYQFNNAMALFGKLKGKAGAPKAPRDVATAVLAALPANSLIKETSLAGPGFVNCKIAPEYLAAKVQAMMVNGVESWAPKLPAVRTVVDFSSPNVAKEMHVGHLRSTIIGDTLCKALEFCGVEVLRLNHIGDWGTQVWGGTARRAAAELCRQLAASECVLKGLWELLLCRKMVLALLVVFGRFVQLRNACGAPWQRASSCWFR